MQEVNCNNLQILFDPYNAGSSKSIGDLDIRLGKLQISSYNVLNKHKQSFVDKDLLLTLNDYSSSTRKLYIGNEKKFISSKEQVYKYNVLQLYSMTQFLINMYRALK